MGEIRTIEAPEEEIQKLRLRPGDILFTEGGDRDKLGRGWIWNGELSECIHQNHIFRARLLADEIQPIYLSLYANQEGQQHFLSSGKQTTNLASISMTKLRDLPIKLPPANEQRRIVAKIETLQERSRKARAALEAIPPLLERFRQSVLAAAFRGDLTADWRAQHPDVEPASVLLDRIRAERRRRWEEAELAKMQVKGKIPKDEKWKERYKEPEQVDESVLPGLPKGWGWATLDELTSKITDGEHISPSLEVHGVCLLSAKDIREYGVDFSDPKFVSEKDALQFQQRCNPQRDDLLIVSRGATIGRSTLVDTDELFCLMGSVILAKLLSPSLSGYVGKFIESSFAKKKLRDMSGASAQQAIYIRDVRSCPIPLPSEKELSIIIEGIPSLLGYVAPLKEAVGSIRVSLDALDQSILAKAFRGELVPQDPNDEPASVLLERIRTEREAQSAKPRTKKKTPGSTKHTEKAPPVSVNENDDLPLFNSLQK